MMSRKRTRKTVREAEAEAVSPAKPEPVVAQATRELTEEEKEFMNALATLVESAQELSYALAVVDEKEDDLSPELKEVLSSARSVVRAVWKFHRLVKKLPRARAV